MRRITFKDGIMTRKTLSTYSRATPPNISHCRGFSLVEVMMSVVLLAIGTTLALPSYRGMVEKQQLSNKTEQAASFVSSTQGGLSEASPVVTASYEQLALDDCKITIQPFILNTAYAFDPANGIAQHTRIEP
jgi:prepilin-type N-terminal cleavage/methylation domain-containing protein